MNTISTLRRPLLILAAAATIVVAGCAGGAAASAPPSSAPPASPAPSDPGGGGSSGNPDTGIGVGVDPGVVDPGLGQPKLVVARPGQLNPHPVGATLLEPSVEGRRVLVKITWYSGVEPCHVLDSVDVDQGGNEFVLTVVEGTSDPNAMCIEIAELKATIVDLGELEPGDYSIRAGEGEAPPITVTVS